MNALTPTKIWLAIEPVDMRVGIDGLATRVQQTLGKSACDGAAYVFRNRRGNRIKVLIWDDTGVWLCQRRLHQGSFVWPKADSTTYCLNTEQWAWLICGVNWQRLSPQPMQQWAF